MADFAERRRLRQGQDDPDRACSRVENGNERIYHPLEVGWTVGATVRIRDMVDGLYSNQD